MTTTTPGILVARSFPGTCEQVAAARHWLEHTLTYTPGQVPDAVTATAVLLLSETVTNAIAHTPAAMSAVMSPCTSRPTGTRSR